METLTDGSSSSGDHRAHSSSGTGSLGLSSKTGGFSKHTTYRRYYSSKFLFRKLLALSP